MTIPDHVLVVLRRLIAEGVPADKIAFMMQLSPEVVQEEIEKFKNNKDVQG